MDTVEGLRKLVGAVYLDAGTDLDLPRADRLKERLLRAFDQTTGEVVLVCSHIAFVDSSGLRVLLEMEREARLRGVRLIVGDPSKPLRQLFALTGLVDVIDLGDTPPTSIVEGTPMHGFPVAPLLSHAH